MQDLIAALNVIRTPAECRQRTRETWCGGRMKAIAPTR
jgi:hypothetical protein